MPNTRENLNDKVKKIRLNAAEVVINSDTLPRFKKMVKEKPIKAFLLALAYETVRLPHSGK